MVSFEIFVKAMPPSLSELKVTPSFCFPFKIPDDHAVTNSYVYGELVSDVFLEVNLILNEQASRKKRDQVRS